MLDSRDWQTKMFLNSLQLELISDLNIYFVFVALFIVSFILIKLHFQDKVKKNIQTIFKNISYQNE